MIDVLDSVYIQTIELWSYCLLCTRSEARRAVHSAMSMQRVAKTRGTMWRMHQLAKGTTFVELYVREGSFTTKRRL